MKDESASPPRSLRLHIVGHVKQDPASPQRLCRVKKEPHSRYVRIDGPSSPPRRQHRRPTKEELPPAIFKARGRIFHYLRGGGYGGASGS